MPKVRRDITNAMVLKLLNDPEYASIKRVARYLDCSRVLVRRVRDGERPDPKAAPPGKLCECCETEPVAPGNRKLCENCYKNVAPYHDIVTNA